MHIRFLRRKKCTKSFREQWIQHATHTQIQAGISIYMAISLLLKVFYFLFHRNLFSQDFKKSAKKKKNQSFQYLYILQIKKLFPCYGSDYLYQRKAKYKTINSQETGLKEYPWLSLKPSGEENGSAFQLFSGKCRLVPTGEAYKEY